MRRFQGGLVSQARRLLHRSTQGFRVIKKKKEDRRNAKLPVNFRCSLEPEPKSGSGDSEKRKISGLGLSQFVSLVRGTGGRRMRNRMRGGRRKRRRVREEVMGRVMRVKTGVLLRKHNGSSGERQSHPDEYL